MAVGTKLGRGQRGEKTGSQWQGLSADRDLTTDPKKEKGTFPLSSSPLSSSLEGSQGWLWTRRRGSRYVVWIPALPQMPAPSVVGTADIAAPAGCGEG